MYFFPFILILNTNACKQTGISMAINNDKVLKTCMGTPPSKTCSGWVKPELGVTVPPLPSKLSGTI